MSVLSPSDWLGLNSEFIGSFAAILTTGSFFPQVLKTWQTRGQGISWMWLLLFGTGVALWVLYGSLRTSVPLILANCLTGLQILCIIAIKLWGGPGA